MVTGARRCDPWIGLWFAADGDRTDPALPGRGALRRALQVPAAVSISGPGCVIAANSDGGGECLLPSAANSINPSARRTAGVACPALLLGSGL